MTETDTRALAQNCRAAARILAHTRTADKNAALLAMADALMADCESILEANRLDLESAYGNLSDAKIDRLRLDRDRLQKMADALREVAALDDPVGRRSESGLRPSGIRVARQRIPLGVILMIYESRPNVTSDAAGLCLKAGNGVILRGGSEAFHSNQAIVKVLQSALDACGLPAEVVSFVADSDRSRLVELLKLDEFIDLVIPRGGEGLIRHVVENSRIPVIKHYKGVCHLYVDESADLAKAVDLLIDGKTSRPGVCNALETLLVHRNAARAFLPLAAQAMHSRGVELRGCERTRSLVSGIGKADESDYEAEYLDLILAVRVVDDLDAALNHIARYGSDHTDVIVTQNLAAAERFLDEVDSSVTAVNASSRFSDGGELGLGAEIGISTTKLHAFGPMGLEALTTQKFIVVGDGQIRHRAMRDKK